MNQNITILIISSQSGDFTQLVNLLERQKYQVQTATSGESALNIALASPPNLILLEMAMPDINGCEICQQIKVQIQTEEIPIIFISASNQIPEKIKAFAVGGIDYISKPFADEEVLVRINCHLTLQKRFNQLKEQNYQFQQEIEKWQRAEKETQQAQLFLNSIIENIPDMIFVKDAQDQKFILFNKAGEELLGYHRKELIGKNDYDFFLPDEADFFTAKDREVLSAKNLLDIPEEKLLTKEKGIRILHTKKIPISDEFGNPQYLLGISEDITERQQAQKALQRSNAILKAQQEAAIDGILVIDEHRKVTSYNQRFCQLWQIPDELMAIGDDQALLEYILSSLQHPQEFLAKVEYLYEQLNEISRDEIHLKNGRIFDRYSAAIFSAEGDCYGRIWYFQDISDRKALERELALREARLNAFFNCATVGMKILDEQLRFVQINPLLAKINHLPIEDHIGKTINEILPTLAPTLEPIYRQVLRTGEPILNLEISAEFPNKPGILYSWVTSYFPIPGEDGSPKGVGTVVVEITERKRAELELQLATERLQHLLTVSPGIIFSFSTQENYPITFVSSNVEVILGYKVEEFVEDTNFWASHIHPEDVERILAQTSQFFAEGEQTQEYRFLCKDGTYRWLYSQQRLVKDSAGNPIESVGYALDISDRKRTEAALKDSEERFKLAVPVPAAAVGRSPLPVARPGSSVAASPTTPPA